MTEFRFYASDCPEAVFLATYLAQLTNPHLFMDLRNMPEVERRAEIAVVTAMLEELAH